MVLVTEGALEAESDGGATLCIHGFIGRIPIRNIWLLMFYASDLFRQRGQREVGGENNPDDIAELVATILTDIVARRLVRNLTSGYRHRHDRLNRVRGRIDLLTTERHQLLARGQVACRFEELTVDTPRNRYVRAALVKVSRLVRREVAHECRTLAGTLERLGVGTTLPSKSEVAADRVGRHDKDDRMMIAAAHLVLQLAIPTETAGNRALPLPDREEQWARLLFERAVGGFFSHALKSQGWQVQTGRSLQWEITNPTESINRLLPGMKTDIWMEHPSTARRLIIDTKFTNVVTTGHWGNESLKSAYIYQLYAYLRAQEQLGDTMAVDAAGMLLHPAIGCMVNESASIHGHKMQFRTVDLTSSAWELRSQLLECMT